VDLLTSGPIEGVWKQLGEISKVGEASLGYIKERGSAENTKERGPLLIVGVRVLKESMSI